MTSKLIEILENFNEHTDISEEKIKRLKSEMRSIDDCLLVGNFIQSKKNYVVALDFFNEALRFDPKNQESLYNCSACCFLLGKNSESLAYLNRLYGQGLSIEVNVAVLSLCKKMGALNIALHFISNINQWTIELLVLKCEISSMSGIRVQCVSDLKLLLSVKTISASYLKRLAIVSAKIRDYQLAIEFNGRYLSIVGESPNDIVRTADLYLMSHDLELALSSIKLLENYTLDNRLLSKKNLILAKIKRLQGDYDAALFHANKSVLIDPSLSEAWTIISDLSRISELSDIKQKLEMVIDTVTMSDFNKINSLYALGNVNARLGLNEEAFKCWQLSNGNQSKLLEKNNKNYSKEQQEEIFQNSVNFNCGSIQISSDYFPIFIVGVPRSGTTLMEKLVGQNPSVQTCGEVEVIPLISSSFISSVNNASDLRVRHEVVYAYQQEYITQAKVTAKRFVDKMPHNIGYISVVKAIFPSAKIIVMERNVLDVALSVFKHNFSDGHNYACNLDDIVDYYYLTKSITQAWVSKYPDDIKVVSYEQLVEHPSEVMSTVYKFLGFRWEDEYLHLKRHDKPNYTFSELQVRKTINNKGVGSWKKYHDQILRDLSDSNKKRISIAFPELSWS